MGKSSIARALEEQSGLKRVETDAMDRNRRSLSEYDFAAYVEPELPEPPEGVVLDVGGDSVFREGADNVARRLQVESLKSTAQLTVVLLVAGKDVVRERYLNCGKPSSSACFEDDWEAWVTHMEPHWRDCADRTVDVSGPLDTNLLESVAYG